MEQHASFFLKSKRFWGMFITAVTAILPVVGPFVGIHVNAGTIMGLGEAGVTLLAALGGFVGLFVTFVGSMKAKGPMVLKPE